MNRGIVVAIIIVAFLFTLAMPADAGCLPASQTAVTAVEAADAYSIADLRWKGSPNYDQIFPVCSKSLLREFACQGAVNVTIRHFEKPSLGTCVANYIATAVYGFYIRKALSLTIFTTR